jgi:hypothetical protein
MSTIVGYSSAQVPSGFAQAKQILKFQDYFKKQEWPSLCVQYPSIVPQVFENELWLIVAIGNVFKTNFKKFTEQWLAATDRGQAFKALDGNFLLYVFDKRSEDIWLATDVLATYPCYYTQQGEDLYFASYLSALKAFLPKPELDRVTFLQIIKFPYCLNQRTIYKDVKTIPYGSYLHFSKTKNQVTINAYLDYTRALVRELPEKEVVARSSEIFADEVMQRASGQSLEHSFISGGTDARMIIGVLHEQHKELFLYAHNCGDENDLYCSRKIAQAVHAKTFFKSFVPDDLAPFSDRTILANDGVVFNLVASGYSLLNTYKEQIKEIYDGYVGGDIFGSHQPETDLAALDYSGLKQLIYGIIERMRPEMFTAAVRQEILDVYHSEIDGFFKKYQGLPNWYLADIFSLLQRQVRHVTGGLQRARTMVDIKTPYASYRLQEVLFALPPVLRNVDKPVQKAVLKELSPLLYRQPECMVRYMGYSDTFVGRKLRYGLHRLNNLRYKLGWFSPQDFLSDQAIIAAQRQKMEQEIAAQATALSQFFDMDYYAKNKDSLSPTEFSKLHLIARVLALYF